MDGFSGGAINLVPLILTILSITYNDDNDDDDDDDKGPEELTSLKNRPSLVRTDRRCQLNCSTKVVTACTYVSGVGWTLKMLPFLSGRSEGDDGVKTT